MSHISRLDLNRVDLLRAHNFIDGKWIEACSLERYDVSDPAIDTVFASVPNSNYSDAQKAVDAATAAFPAWKVFNARERARLLKRWHALILNNSEDLSRIMSREQGKPLSEARGEVSYGASYVEWFAEEAVRINGDLLPALIPGKRQSVVKEPVGVVAAITPWNFPLAMIARKIAPALAAGCTVVAKPAEDTPLTALALVKLAEEAGFPAGVINIITASRENVPDTVRAWLRDARVRKITFTGSTAVGKYLARESADTLKKLSLELGGNAPFIVFEDADLDAAIEGLMQSKFRNSGQTCICPNRVFVHADVYEDFAQRLVTQVETLRIGPADKDSEIGPLINERAVEKVNHHVQDALSKGAELLTGGKSVCNEIAVGPYFYAPTVLGEATPDMNLYSEETFGPIVALFRFSDEDEVICQANDSPHGLASYFYTTSIKRIHKVAAQLEAGVIGINEGMVTSAVAPFGGIKESGYGREGSRYGIDDYLHLKYMCQGQIA